jgi:hypothetical protein
VCIQAACVRFMILYTMYVTYYICTQLLAQCGRSNPSPVSGSFHLVPSYSIDLGGLPYMWNAMLFSLEFCPTCVMVCCLALSFTLHVECYVV